jgi:acyl-CoA thioesterase FadM
MYVWARLARMVATLGSRGPYRPGDETRLSFRCLPSDIDRNIHLNNARYLMLADVGRVDIFFRSGLMRLYRERGWSPLMGGVEAAYVREIRLWRRFDVVSSIETWEGSQVIGRHKFVLDDGRTAAMLMTTAGVYDGKAGRFVAMEEVIAALGFDTAPRPPTQAEQNFMASHGSLRAMAKKGG